MCIEFLTLKALVAKCLVLPIVSLLILTSHVALGADTEFALDKNLALGKGFDSLQLIARGDCVKSGGTISQESQNKESQNIVYHMSIIESTQELKDKLGVTASASLKAAFWSLESKAEFVDSSNINNYSVHLLVLIRVANSREQLEDVVLREDTLELLLQGKNERFRERCGDEYVLSRTTGGELFGLLTIQTSNEEQKRDLRVSLKGSLAIFRAEGEFDQNFRDVTTNNSTEIDMSVSGGLGLKMPTTLQELVKLAETFPEVVAEQGALLTAHTQDYNALPRQSDSVSPIDISRQNEVLVDLAQLLDEVNLKLSDIGFIGENQKQFPGVELAVMADAKRLLLNDKNTIRDVVYACHQRREDCRIPELAVHDVILPKREGGETMAGTPEGRLLAIALGRDFGAEQRDLNGWTDLHYAAVLDDHVLASHLIGNRANIRSSLKPSGRLTDLLKEQLNRLGYDIGKDRRNLQTPLHIAAQENAADVIATVAAADREAIDIEDGTGRTPLHYAAAANATEALKQLLARGTNVNAQDREGRTALHLAAQSDSAQVIRILVREANIKANLVDEKGKTPLRYAAELDAVEAVGALVEAGAEVWTKDSRGRTALHHAVNARSVGAVTVLIRGLTRGDNRLDVGDKDLRTPLHYASGRRTGDEKTTAIVRALLEMGAQPNVQDEDGDTPLHYAAENDLKDVVTALLDRGATLDARGDDQETPLHRALDKGSLGAAKILLDRNANVQVRDRKNRLPLHAAVRGDDERITKMLLHAGANVRAADEDGRTALHMAASHNAVNAIRPLLEDDLMQVDARTTKGDTALHFAAARDSANVMRPLLYTGQTNTNARNNARRTPLHLAAQNGAVNAILTLLDQDDVDVNARDKDEWTPLHFATAEEADRAVEVLLSHEGISVNARDEDLETPLHWASRRGAGSIVEKLLRAGASERMKNEDGETAMSYWKKFSQEEVDQFDRIIAGMGR